METKNMNLVFNLKKAFGPIRQAMALVYNDQMQWWRIDEIEAGDPSWKEWVDGNPEQGLQPNKSLINSLADARNDYYKRKLLFRARYGVTDSEVNTFYRMYIGYNPMVGMRALHIGPYTAMPGAWKRTIDALKKSGKSLTSENLLALANAVQLPEIPPDFDLKAKENKAHPLKKAYDTKTRERRSILEVRADLQNHFNYFTKTYNKIDRKDMNRGVNIYLQKLLKSVGTMFTEDDLGMIVKSFPPEKVGQLEGKVTGWVNTKFDSIDPNTPDGAKLMGGNVLLGDGSYLILNSQGINKLLQKTAQDNNWQDIYENAIKMIADSNQISIDEARKLITENSKFSELFIEQLRNIQEELKKTGDFRADFLDIALAKPKDTPKIGAQQTQTNRISKTQWSIVELKLDILKTILDLNSDDPTKVAEALNISRRTYKTKAKGAYTAELAQMWIDAIKSEDQQMQKIKKKKQIRTYQEIYDSTQKDYDFMSKNEDLRDAGSEDLETALKFASMSYMKSPLEFIDKKTKTKLQLVDSPNMFAREGDDIPVNAKRMTELRREREKKGTEADLKKALKEEILKEIGDANAQSVGTGGMETNVDATEVAEIAEIAEVGEEQEPTETTGEFDFGVTEVPQEKIPGTPQQPTPTTPTTPVPNVEESFPKEPETPKKLDLKSLFGNTLESLIIMARDLDNQGKGESAEEIHQIIRKYQNRL